MKERDKFGSRLGFILVSAGCAVGLGNVWKFPYICGQNGGAAFILIYLVFLTILGLPILISEFAVGRGSRFGVAKAYEKLEPEGTKWYHFKWFSIFGQLPADDVLHNGRRLDAVLYLPQCQRDTGIYVGG